jgi:hypothetical protein
MHAGPVQPLNTAIAGQNAHGCPASGNTAVIGGVAGPLRSSGLPRQRGGDAGAVGAGPVFSAAWATGGMPASCLAWARLSRRVGAKGTPVARPREKEKTMSTVIKGGTIVAADRTYEADILIEGETIAAIGKDLKGDKTLDAEGAYVMPGGIDPHTHMELPFMGTAAAETFECGTKAALSGGTTMIVDFVIPGSRRRCSPPQDWHARPRRRPRPIIPSTWRDRLGRSRSSTRWKPKVVDLRHQHLQALHGLQGRADGQ